MPTMRVFVIDWHSIDIQNDVAMIEAMGHEVCGVEHHDVVHAADAIRLTEPDVVVAWANRGPERTASALRRILEQGSDPAPLPVVFIDAALQDQSLLRESAAPVAFTDVGHLDYALDRMERGIKKAHRALEHAREEGHVSGALA